MPVERWEKSSFCRRELVRDFVRIQGEWSAALLEVMRNAPLLHGDMTPREILKELGRHKDPRFACQCMACIYGRSLLAQKAAQPGIAMKWWSILLGRQAA